MVSMPLNSCFACGSHSLTAHIIPCRGIRSHNKIGICVVNTRSISQTGTWADVYKRQLYLRPRVGGYEAMLWVDGMPKGTFATKIVVTRHGNHYCDMLLSLIHI